MFTFWLSCQLIFCLSQLLRKHWSWRKSLKIREIQNDWKNCFTQRFTDHCQESKANPVEIITSKNTHKNGSDGPPESNGHPDNFHFQDLFQWHGCRTQKSVRWNGGQSRHCHIYEGCTSSSKMWIFQCCLSNSKNAWCSLRVSWCFGWWRDQTRLEKSNLFFYLFYFKVEIIYRNQRLLELANHSSSFLQGWIHRRLWYSLANAPKWRTSRRAGKDWH